MAAASTGRVPRGPEHPVAVRPADPADDDAIARLTLAAYDALGSVSDEYRAILTDVATRRRDASAVLVAEAEGLVVGSVTFALGENEYFDFDFPGDGDCGFRMLAVAPEAWGCGAGRALLDACLDLARASDRRRLAIMSMDWMPRAHEMYLRRGFRRAPHLDHEWPSGWGLGFVLDL